MELETDAAGGHLADAAAAIDGIVSRSDKLGRLSRILDAEQDDAIDLARELRRERETGDAAATLERGRAVAGHLGRPAGWWHCLRRD